MRARGEPERADLLRVEPAFLRLAADEPDGALPVLPRALVDRQPLRARRPVGEAHANEPEFGELLRDPVNPLPVAAILITAAGNEQHASAVFRRRRLIPVEIRHRMFRRLESRRLHLLGGRRDLLGWKSGIFPSGHSATRSSANARTVTSNQKQRTSILFIVSLPTFFP